MSTRLYVYRNRFVELSADGNNDITTARPNEWPDVVYFYHNSFSGRVAINWRNYPDDNGVNPIQGKSANYVVNNILSANSNLIMNEGWNQCGIRADYNWIGPGGGYYSNFGVRNVFSMGFCNNICVNGLQ